MFDTVIFDFDNTIAKTETAHRKSFEKFFKNYNVKISQEYWYEHYVGKGSDVILKDIIKRHDVDQDMDLKDMILHRRELYIESLKSINLDVVEGFYEFIKKIDNLGLKKIIASSSGRIDLIASMENVGISHFEFVCADDISNLKPDPEVFLKAAEKTKSLPNKCIVIEDSYAGVQAAKKAGMYCIALTTSEPSDELYNHNADLVVNNYDEINFDEILRL